MRGLVFMSLVTTALLFAPAATAQQQPWLVDRRYREGIGIRAGNLELHPGIAAEVGYDQNFFQRSSGEDPGGTGRLRLTPSFFFSTLSPQRLQGSPPPSVRVRGGVAASYNEFLGEEQFRRQRNVGILSSLDLSFAPEAEVGGNVYANYQRLFQPSNSPDTNIAFDRNVITAGAGAIWRPGRGLLSWRLGYEAQALLFEELPVFNNVRHEVNTQGRWRFLPRTALLYDASVGFIDYLDGDPIQNNGTPVRTRLGLNGLITNRLALLAMAGWGASFYRENVHPVQDFDSLIAQAELKFFVQAQPDLPEDSAAVGLSTIAVGYLRDFSNGFIGDWFQRDRGYANAVYLLGGWLVTTAEVGLTRVGNPQSYIVTDAGAVPRFPSYSELRVDALASAEYRLSETFGINTTIRYDANLTDNRIPVDDTGQFLDNLAFQRFQVYLGARWFM